MVDALRRSPASDAFLLPGAAFNEDGVTLDGMSVREIAERSGTGERGGDRRHRRGLT